MRSMLDQVVAQWEAAIAGDDGSFTRWVGFQSWLLYLGRDGR